MFNDPKYKNLVNDIAGILAENDKNHYENLLPEAVVAQLEVCVNKISEMPISERTAEGLAEVLKHHFYEGIRNSRIEPNNEMSTEFYRRVHEMMKTATPTNKDKKSKKPNHNCMGAY